MKDVKIILNKVKCKKCKSVISSLYTHDFRTCKCGSLSVDGGLDYLKRVGNFEDAEDMSVFFKNLAVICEF